jgi:hypothetical protein
MRTRLLAALVVILTAALLTTTPMVAEAAKLITGKNIKDSSVTGKDIKDRSLSGSDVKDTSLTGTDLQDGSVSGGDVADSSVTGADVLGGSLDGSDLKDGSVDSADLKDGSIAGGKIADNGLTGADVDESTLDKVPVAGSLALLGSGQTQSGTFGMGTGSTTGSAGYLGTSINYPRALDVPIADNHVIDTEVNPDPVNCAGPGQAAPGYLCLYFEYHSGIDYVYGYSDIAPYNVLPDSVGVALYAQIDDDGEVYADGVWTVTAP